MTTPAVDRIDQRHDAGGHEAAVRDLEAAFAELMATLRHAYAQAAEVASPGMLPGTFKLLTMIDRMGPVTASALAERLGSDKGLISRTVTELEDLGLVVRRPDAADGRIRLIAVTSFGRERLEMARVPYLARMRKVIADWPPSSVERLTHLLRALAAGQTPAL